MLEPPIETARSPYSDRAKHSRKIIVAVGARSSCNILHVRDLRRWLGLKKLDNRKSLEDTPRDDCFGEDFMNRSSRPRRTARLSNSVLHQLHSYALAASAAGVGVLALVPPAEARIIYTPAHINILPNTSFGLDLNHDGRADFVISNLYGWRSTYTYVGGSLNALGVGGGGIGVLDGYARKSPRALALSRGFRIGPPKDASYFRGAGRMTGGCHLGCFWSASWAGVNDRYLGLQFQTGGTVHYGWARLSVKALGQTFGETFGFKYFVLLSGYAYETIPNKPIIAGQTKDGANGTATNANSAEAATSVPKASPARPVAEIPKQTSVGALALGAPGLPLWRRKEELDSAQ